MGAIDCAAGERLQLGVGACLQVTGCAAELIYVFVETAWDCALVVERGFRASTPGDAGWISSVLALAPGAGFWLGATYLRIEALAMPTAASLLRPYRVCVDAPQGLAIARHARLRPCLHPRPAVCPTACVPLLHLRQKEPLHAP